MTTVNLSPYSGVGAQLFDNNGDPLTGGKIFTYQAGTTTPLTTYTTNTGITAHANPIILDAAGRVPSSGEIWTISGRSYKFVVKDSNDVTIATYDNVFSFVADDNVVSVFDFMSEAQQQDVTAGTLLLDVTTPIQNAIDSIERGVLVFPPGYYKTTATVNIANKNDQNDSTQSNLEISAYGAKIVSSVTGSTAALYISACKRLIMRGLEVSAASSSLTVQVQGLWNSTWDSCNLGSVQFSSLGASFDSHYWNKFQECEFGVITINTGTSPNISEFNANTFDTCRLWGSDYAIKKYGSHSIEDITFVNCDISYQSTAILYVDVATSGNMSFIGGYFDSAAGFPTDTKGIQLDFMGSIWNPNSANVSSFLAGTASRSQSKSGGGVRVGDRIPTSGYNLIRNGDIRAGNAGFSTSNSTTTITSGTGIFGQYAKFTSSVAFGNFSFSSINVPVTGTYTLTVIGRANTAGISVNSCNGTFGVISLTSDWTISSFTTTIAQGASVAFTVTNGATGSMDYDIAYVGLTYGSSAPLYAPIHPSADFYSPGTVQGGFTNVALTSATMSGIRTEGFQKLYTPSTSPTNILAISSGGHTTFEVDVFYIDGDFENGTFLQKVYVATIGSGNNVTNINIAQENKVKNVVVGGTDYLTWTASVVSNQVMLIATASSATAGTGTLYLQVTGRINGATVQ
jgi:hypothetical protein